MIDGSEEVAVPIKLLNAAILSISHIDRAVRTNLNGVRQVELTRGDPCVSPFEDVRTFSGVFKNAGIAVAVCDV